MFTSTPYVACPSINAYARFGFLGAVFTASLGVITAYFGVFTAYLGVVTASLGVFTAYLGE